MKNTKNQQILIGGAVVFRENRGKRQYLLVKQKKEDKDWEIAKVTVRKGESSVRSVIRLTGEQGGMSARVLEEAGRATGNTIINGKSIPQKFYYYLMLVKGGPSELLGFDEAKWLEYADAAKKLVLKREKEMLKGAKDVLKEWEKTHNLKKQEIQPF